MERLFAEATAVWENSGSHHFLLLHSCLTVSSICCVVAHGLGGEFRAVLFVQGVPRVLRAGLFGLSQRSVLDMRCGYSVFVFFLLEVFCGGPSSLADRRHGRLFLDHFSRVAILLLWTKLFSPLPVGPGDLFLVGLAGTSKRRIYYEQI
jgi:hypothetical protein